MQLFDIGRGFVNFLALNNKYTLLIIFKCRQDSHIFSIITADIVSINVGGKESFATEL